MHGGVGNYASAGQRGLTHIVIVFFVLELAAAGDGCYDGRGRAGTLLFIIWENLSYKSCQYAH